MLPGLRASAASRRALGPASQVGVPAPCAPYTRPRRACCGPRVFGQDWNQINPTHRRSRAGTHAECVRRAGLTLSTFPARVTPRLLFSALPDGTSESACLRTHTHPCLRLAGTIPLGSHVCRSAVLPTDTLRGVCGGPCPTVGEDGKRRRQLHTGHSIWKRAGRRGGGTVQDRENEPFQEGGTMNQPKGDTRASVDRLV